MPFRRCFSVIFAIYRRNCSFFVFRRRSDHNTVTPGVLAHVELFIRPVQEFLQRGGEIVFLHADGDRDEEIVVLVVQLHFFHREAQVVHQNARFVQVHAGDEEAELLPAPAADAVTAEGMLHEKFRQLDQRVVTAVVAVGIVDMLEEIDIGDRDTEGLVRTGLVEFLDRFDHGAAVRKPGQGVRAGFLVQILVLQAELALRILEVRAEDDAHAGQCQEERHGIQGLVDCARIVGHGKEHRITLRHREQEHPDRQDHNEPDDLVQGLFIDVEEDKHQQQGQQVLHADAPSEVTHVPGDPADTKHRVNKQVHPDAPVADRPERSACQRHEQHREPLPLPVDQGKQEKANGEINQHQPFAEQEGAAIIERDFLSRPWNLLMKKTKEELQHSALAYDCIQ